MCVCTVLFLGPLFLSYVYRSRVQAITTKPPCGIVLGAAAHSILEINEGERVRNCTPWTRQQGARSSDLRRLAMQAGRLSVALRTPLVAARSLCTKIRPLSDEWARVGLGANRAAPHEKLNRLLFVQCGFGCDRESPPKSTGVS